MKKLVNVGKSITCHRMHMRDMPNPEKLKTHQIAGHY